jgi:hypothetical protein
MWKIVARETRAKKKKETSRERKIRREDGCRKGRR